LPSGSAAGERVTVTILVCCAITNLARIAPGPGLPDGWELRGVRGAPRPELAVTDDGALRMEGTGAAGFAIFELDQRLAPATGALSWRWRTATPLSDADLRNRNRDDSPARVMVVFDDGRMLFYSWGATGRVGEWFESWTGSDRIVVVLRRAVDADGAWHTERRDPFADYRMAFGSDPPAIVAVGVVQDTDQLDVDAWAEVAALSWTPDA
jgi:hypothetical protein